MSEAALAAEPQNRVVLRILPFALIIVCGYLPVGIPLATLPLEVHDKLGFGTLVVGIVVGVQSLVTLFTRPLAGILCDRAGAKVAVLTGAGISIAASAIYLVSTIPAFGASGALALLLTARVISGLAESLIMTGSLSWAIGTVGPQHTGKVMVWVGIGMYAAIAAGAPLGITLMKYQGAYGGFAAASMAMIVFSLLTVPAAAYVVPVAPQGGERLAFLRVVGRILPAGMGLALATLGFGAIGAFAALDFQNRGWPGAGFVLATFGVAYIATRLAFGGWPDRFGGARVAAWSLLVEACGLAPSRFAGRLGARGGLYESATVRVHPTGHVTVLIGTHNHGQGHETTFAQIVSEKLGVSFENIDIVLIRENLEGLYVAFEHYIQIGDDPHAVAISSGVNTRDA